MPKALLLLPLLLAGCFFGETEPPSGPESAKELALELLPESSPRFKSWLKKNHGYDVRLHDWSREEMLEKGHDPAKNELWSLWFTPRLSNDHDVQCVVDVKRGKLLSFHEQQ